MCIESSSLFLLEVLQLIKAFSTYFLSICGYDLVYYYQMRLIVRNRQGMHVWSVSDYIKQAQANIIKQDSHRIIALQNVFQKLYLRQQQNYAHDRRLSNSLNNIALMGSTPARAIADHFHSNRKSFSPDALTTTLLHISRAYLISRDDNGGTLDTIGYRLYLSSNLSEELKYALKNNKLNFRQVVNAIEACIQMQYVDHEVFQLLLNYTERQIIGGDYFQPLPGRQFQIQKKNYYNPQDIALAQTIRDSQQIDMAMGFVKQIYHEWQQYKANTQNISVPALQQLVNSLAKTSRNFRSIVQGILSIRRQYVKMVDLSKDELILRDPNINLDLLLLEEKLLALHLISIQDIKNPQQLHVSSYEIKRVEEILRAYLNIDKIQPVFDLVDKTGIEVQPYQKSTEPDLKKVSALLNLLARMSSLDRFVYHNQQGRSLVNLKWQKTLTEQTSGNLLPGYPLKQQLNVARIFRRTYQETMSFFNKHIDRLQLIFKYADPESRVTLMQAYCRIGLHVQAIVEGINLEKNQSLLQVKDLSHEGLCSLLHLFNQVGLFINVPKIHISLLNRLKMDLHLEQSNRLKNTLEHTIDALNYLLQNHRNNKSFRPVYEGYLRILENKATYPVHHQNNQLITEAIKILALEKPQKYGSHPAHLSYLQAISQDKLKRNPFYSILRETCYRWCNKEQLLRKVQPFLPLGVSQGVPSSLVFGNSEDTSYDGQIRTGNFNSYIIRLETKNSMNVHQFSVNSFLQPDVGRQQLFRLKPKQTLFQRFQQVFEIKADHLDIIMKQHEKSINQILEVYPDCLITRNIQLKIAMINQLRKNNFSLETKQQQHTNNVLYFLEMLQLHKLLLLLKKDKILKKVPNKTIKQTHINTPLIKRKVIEDQEEELVEIQIDKMAENLRQLKLSFSNSIRKIANIITQTLPKISAKSKPLQGQRQTLQQLNEKQPNNPGQLASIFINQAYFNDKTFCEYQDWKERISKEYDMKQFSLQNTSNLTKILVNKFCKGLTNKLTYLPINLHSKRFQRLDLHFKLLSPEEKHSKQKNLLVNQSDVKDLNYIINLQNFKHQLKSTFSQEALLEYIFGFKFVLQLSNKNLNKDGFLLKRNPKSYFDYLENIHEQAYLDSPYARYILKHLSKTDQLRLLLDQRKNIRIKQRIHYQNGSISAQEYYKRIEKIDNAIINAAEQLKGKMLDHMENQMLDGEFKMVDLRKEDLESFEQLIRKNISYHRQFDVDFIHSNGDYQAAIQLKRGRAERNYVKMYLLYQLSEEKKLNAKEKELLNQWIKQVVKGTTQLIVFPNFSNMAISDIGWEDNQALRLKSSNLNINRNMLLVDFIMELNLFLDESIIQRFQRQVRADHISKKYNIPLFFFQQSGLKGLTNLENRVEDAVIDEASRLSKTQIDTLQEMFKTFKTEGFKERNRYKELFGNFRQQIQQINTQSIRNQLIQQYVRLLEDEFVNQYNPSLVADIKQKQSDILWRQIFHNPYDHCNKDQLRQISNKLILRMELMKHHPPPFFGSLFLNLLMHPQLDPLTKQALIAAVQYNRIELNIDSSDIEQLINMRGRQVGEQTIAKQTLRWASRARLDEYIYQKARSLV